MIATWERRGFIPEKVVLFRQYGRKDPINRWLEQALSDIQLVINRAGAGAINQKRHLIEADIERQLATVKSEYNRQRKQHAQELVEAVLKRGAERSKGTSEQRTANALELSMKFDAMSDEEIRDAYWKIASAQTRADIAGAVSSASEGTALAAALRKRGDVELADNLRARLAAVPEVVIGHPDEAAILDEAAWYARNPDEDTAQVQDERGGKIGIVVDEMLDLSPLENLPAEPVHV